MNKKKVGAVVTTLAVGAAVLLTGTYAYQSLNQEAINEASGIVNPGGRLHDDFNYNNDVKRIYVENFGDQNIYARIQLSEYMELGVGAGQGFDETTRNVKKITATANYNNQETWSIHKYNVTNETTEYMTLDYAGSSVAYMPTFNMNKDSLEADINGTYAQKYADYVDYSLTENASKTANEIRDVDTNTVDEYKDGTGAVDVNYSSTEATHNVANTLNSCVMSMDEYMALNDTTKGTTACWVYDTDGWAYWSQPIAPKTATGTLINDIDVKNVDDNWFYALKATAQFVTADDLGNATDGTGFYDLDKGTAPSDNALELLKGIGVDTPETASAYSLARGSSSANTVYFEGTTIENVTIEGSNSTGTKVDESGNIVIGNFETASSITVSATVDGTEESVEIAITDGSTLQERTDVSMAIDRWSEGSSYSNKIITNGKVGIYDAETDKLVLVASTATSGSIDNKISENVEWEVVTSSNLPSGIQIVVEDSVLQFIMPGGIDVATWDGTEFVIYAITESGYVQVNASLSLGE